MGIFSRFKDIVSANLNAMLDRAEDPDKLIRLMIREMEETLVELKANCAQAMAVRAAVARDVDGLTARAAAWEERARLAVAKGRDDMAREALAEKRRLLDRGGTLRRELSQAGELVEQAREDIARLEDKLAGAREKQRLLVQRDRRAEDRTRCRRQLRAADSADAMRRFESLEQRIERKEALAELEGSGPDGGPDGDRRAPGLEERFRALERDEEIEAELARLKGE